MEDFKLKLEDVWNAVKSESFVFNFKNSLSMKIYNEMQNHNVDRGKVDDMIEKMVRDGKLMLPKGYDTIQTLR